MAPPLTPAEIRRAREKSPALRLAELHGQYQTGQAFDFVMARGYLESWLPGAGFARARNRGEMPRLRRLNTVPDYVSRYMTVLICGLNPSPASSENGVGFFGPSNRFWPAAIAAGLCSVDRDPLHALLEHGMGMTDIVKRTTRRADEVGADEFRGGMERLTWVVGYHMPRVVIMVGLTGWRQAVDRKAQTGWQPEGVLARPVYLMPSTSGLNAHETLDSLTAHFRTAAVGPEQQYYIDPWFDQR